VAVIRQLRLPTPRWLLELAIVGGAYYGSARRGLALGVVGHRVTPLGPATGVAVIAFLAFGFGVWPAVLAAAFAVNVPITPSTLAAAAIAVGNTAAPLLAAWLLRAARFRIQLDRLRDALALCAFALLVMTVSASVGTATLVASGAVSDARFDDTWLVWWTGDAMGVLIVAPFLWSLWSWWPLHRARPDWRRVGEAVLLFSVLGVTAWAISMSTDPLLFVVLPLLVWIGWRYQQRGAGPAALLVSLIFTIAAAHRTGVFEDMTLLRRMEVLQAFNTAVCLASFVFAAAVAQRRAEQDALYAREHRIAETLQ
jgi:integral membrane sensor domain MASE1